jgi:hypothetical protein
MSALEHTPAAEHTAGEEPPVPQPSGQAQQSADGHHPWTCPVSGRKTVQFQNNLLPALPSSCSLPPLPSALASASPPTSHFRNAAGAGSPMSHVARHDSISHEVALRRDKRQGTQRCHSGGNRGIGLGVAQATSSTVSNDFHSPGRRFGALTMCPARRAIRHVPATAAATLAYVPDRFGRSSATKESISLADCYFRPH